MVTNSLFEKIQEVVQNEGIEVYHIEYVKENNENYLRVYIDKDNGVTINDCVTISKKISGDYLDMEDPISDAYTLEVSSPGIERILYTEAHIRKFEGSQVNVLLNSLHLGMKKLTGELGEVNENDIIIHGEEMWSIPKGKIKRIKVKGEF